VPHTWFVYCFGILMKSCQYRSIVLNIVIEIEEKKRR
jgi:hypothetical protein